MIICRLFTIVNQPLINIPDGFLPADFLNPHRVFSEYEAADSAQKEAKKDVIIRESIRLNQKPVSKEEAIRAAGELLVEGGCVEPEYVDAMLERERLVSTYMGMGIAIPHGTAQAKGTVMETLS